MMAILYAVVARGNTLLAEFSAVAGNTGAVVRRILKKLSKTVSAESRLCFSQNRYFFHILRPDGLTFLCMANDTFGIANIRVVFIVILMFAKGRIPFSYLEVIQTRFMKNYGRVASYAPVYAMNDEFSRVLQQQMEFFSCSPDADSLNRVRSEVNEVRTIKVHNIDKILQRGGKIELLIDKTATMQDSAFHFKKQSVPLSGSMVEIAKLLVMLACLIFVLLHLISVAACGGITLPSCRSK